MRFTISIVYYHLLMIAMFASDGAKCCRSTEQMCDSGQCIPASWFCDGRQDCPNGTDEMNCRTKMCSSDEFMCSDGKCIPRTWFCDGLIDCGQGEDERNCSSREERGCNGGQYRCLDDTCIPESWVCDRRRDCSAGEEETNCSSSECGQQTIGSSPLGISELIRGGTRAVPGEWPWQAALYRDNIVFICGATIISNQWLVTAAHCLMQKTASGQLAPVSSNRFKVRVGSNERLAAKFYTVAYVYANPNYISSSPFPNDIGLIRLSKPLELTASIQPICLPDSTWQIADIQECFVTGWGYTVHPETPYGASNYLKKARMKLIPLRSCRLIYSRGLSALRHICARGASGRSTACKGDSGGPLSCRESANTWKLVGVVSFGKKDCRASNPMVFTRVTSFIPWINEIIKGNTE